LVSDSPRTRGPQLTRIKCHNNLQNQALALPGQNFLVNPNRIAIGQVVAQCQSYVNAIPIQRGGDRGGRGGAGSGGRTKGGRLTQRGAVRKTHRGTGRAAGPRAIT
jgi:hypothetical protein